MYKCIYNIPIHKYYTQIHLTIQFDLTPICPFKTINTVIYKTLRVNQSELVGILKIIQYNSEKINI